MIAELRIVDEYAETFDIAYANYAVELRTPLGVVYSDVFLNMN